MSIIKFMRPDLLTLGSYSAHKPPESLTGAAAESVLKLDANENPYGFSQSLTEALAGYRRYHIYPDAAQARLRLLLQDYAGVDASCIVAANGSGELLDYILCLLLEPGDEVINSIPTFDLYRLRTLINGGHLLNIPRKEDFSLDMPAIKAAVSPRTKLIIIANPNNPTGNAVPQEQILELINTGLPVLVDEAYYEFCGETVVPLVNKYPNLMVLRTFSKWAGLAGLRIGYGLFPPEVASYLMKIKMPYNVNVAALVGVEVSLRHKETLLGKVKAIISERERLFTALGRIGWLKPYPSRANFIFTSVLKGDGLQLCREMETKGILLRYFDQPLVKNGFRVSVGTPEDTDRLIKELVESIG